MPEPIKQEAFRRLQESAVPATDKIFPWLVVAVINWVIEELIRGDLQGLRKEIKETPAEIGLQIATSVNNALSNPVEEIRAARQDVRILTQELRASAVLDASLAQSGWRGIGAAVGAIFRLENLGAVVAGMISVGFLTGFAIAHWFASRDRGIIQFNQGVIQDCHQNYAADADKNGWYTCPNFQLPMPRQ